MLVKEQTKQITKTKSKPINKPNNSGILLGLLGLASITGLALASQQEPEPLLYFKPNINELNSIVIDDYKFSINILKRELTIEQNLGGSVTNLFEFDQGTLKSKLKASLDTNIVDKLFIEVPFLKYLNELQEQEFTIHVYTGLIYIRHPMITKDNCFYSNSKYLFRKYQVPPKIQELINNFYESFDKPKLDMIYELVSETADEFHLTSKNYFPGSHKQFDLVDPKWIYHEIASICVNWIPGQLIEPSEIIAEVNKWTNFNLTEEEFYDIVLK